MIPWLKSIFYRRAYGEWVCESPVTSCFVCKADGWSAHESSSWRVRWRGDCRGLIAGARLRHPGSSVSVNPIGKNEYQVLTFRDITEEVKAR